MSLMREIKSKPSFLLCALANGLCLIFTLPFIAACSSGPLVKAQLDDEVRRLCAIDGGIKVYETVSLSVDKFNQWGQVKFYNPTEGEQALGVDYIFKRDRHFYREGSVELWRTKIEVFRRVDKAPLGESMAYTRRGGDITGPWHDSSYTCPDISGETPLLEAIFKKQSETGSK